MKQSILFIGAGRMAESIIAGLYRKNGGNLENVFISNRNDSNRLEYLVEKYEVKMVADWKEIINEVEVIVLAIPPDQHPIILEQMNLLITNQFIVTIAAGIGPTFLETYLPEKTPVAWMMPNTAAEVGHSMTLFTYGNHVKVQHEQTMEFLLNAIGHSHYCSENDIHLLTAITGSAPAFLYLFVEAIIDTTEQLGVSRKVASELVSEMVYGSIEMLKTGQEPQELRSQVTTPGGATAEGIKVLKEGGFEELLKKAVLATNKKAKGENE